MKHYDYETLTRIDTFYKFYSGQNDHIKVKFDFDNKLAYKRNFNGNE